MRIWHVFKDYYPPTHGGIEQHLHAVVHGLDSFEFSVLTASRSLRHVVEHAAPVRIMRTAEYLRTASTPFTPAWVRLLRHADADLLHFHVPNAFGELAYLAARPGAPMVATYHADVVGRRALGAAYAPLQQRFLTGARSIVVSSPVLRDSSPALGSHRARTEVIPFGVDPDEWSGGGDLAETLRERHRPPLVLFLGRLRYYKGIDVLIDAMAAIEGTLLIAGDGPRRPALERHAARSAAADRTVFLGEVADRDRVSYYRAADVFVLPSTSRAEAFGIAMLEAMASGTPVICTEVGTGTSWVNRDGETGLVVPPRSSSALGAALKAILNDRQRRREMGLSAAARVRARFTKTAMLEAIRSLYESVGMSRAPG